MYHNQVLTWINIQFNLNECKSHITVRYRLLQLKVGSQYCTTIQAIDFTVRTTSDVDVARLLLLGATSAVVTLETLSPSISDTFTTTLTALTPNTPFAPL